MATLSSSSQALPMQIDSGESYRIKPRTMEIREDELIVQVESPVDFVSLTHHDVDLTNYLLHQDLDMYFRMLNGPTYENLVKYFWVRAEVYDQKAAKREEREKIAGDKSLEGKTRQEMGLKEFTGTEIRSNVMGIPITITEEIIGKAARRSNDGNFEWNLDKKTSPWRKTTYEALYRHNASDKYRDMQKEHKVLQKLIQECFLPKGGGTDTLSLDHQVFLYFLVKFEKVNLPKYMFQHMIWALRKSKKSYRKFIPYGRLLSEIFFQGGLLNALKQLRVVSDDHLGTITGKYINAKTLKSMSIVKKVEDLESDLKESMIVSDLMVDFPPISKQDNYEVLAAFVTTHYEKTGEIINLSSIPETQAGVPLRVAKKRKSKKDSSETVDEAEPKAKKLKKAKVAPQLNVVERDLPTQVLEKRTRGGTSEEAVLSQSQPNVQKKRRTVRKLKVFQFEEEEQAKIEEDTALVKKVLKDKKTEESSSGPQSKSVDAESQQNQVVEDAKKVAEYAEAVKDLATKEAGELLKETVEVQREKTACSEVSCSGATTSEAAETRDNNPSHTISNNVTDLDSTPPSHSSETIDDITLNRIYKNLDKASTPSPSAKTQKKPDDDVFVPMYPFVLERLGDLAQRRIDVCQPLNHPPQPPYLQPLQTLPVDEQFEEVPAEPASSDNVTSSSSHPQSTNQPNETNEIDELSDHYKGELPSYVSSSEKAFEIAHDIAISESPQQHQPEQRPKSPIPNTHESSSPVKPVSDAITLVSEEQTHDVQPISVALIVSLEAASDSQPSHELSLEPSFTITSDSDAEDEHTVQANVSLDSSSPFVLEFVHDPPVVEQTRSETTEILNTDKPCSSTQIIPQPVTTNVSPPSTLLLDSLILKEVCGNIFEDLNKLVETRNNFVHIVNYEDQWTALRERVDFVMCELQKLSLEAHNQSLNNLNNWFKDVANSMKEVEVNRNQEKSRLYISDTPLFLDASSIITASVHTEDLNLSWLTKLKIHSDAPILEKLKHDSAQEQKIKKLERDLFEQKMLYENLKRNMDVQKKEFRAREEAQARVYDELKEAMKKQSDMMREMMEMMKNQAKP